MSKKHDFKHRFKDYALAMRLSIPFDAANLTTIANNIERRQLPLTEIPSIAVALCLAVLPIKGSLQESRICKTIEYTARHICGTHDDKNLEGVLKYFSKHAGWDFNSDRVVFGKLIEFMRQFAHAHHKTHQRYHPA